LNIRVDIGLQEEGVFETGQDGGCFVIYAPHAVTQKGFV